MPEVEESRRSLSNNELHLWHVDILSPQIERQFTVDYISQEERDRASRYAFPYLRKRYLMGRFALRSIMGNYLDISPKNIRLELDKNKKPLLNGATNLCFNLSYSKNKIIIGVAKSKIGVDIEFLDPDFAYEEIALGYFGKREMEFIKNHQDPRKGFYKIWTRKEAFLKALGIGLVDDLPLVDCSDGVREIDLPEYYTDEEWVVQSFSFGSSFLISTCGAASISAVCFFDFDLSFDNSLEGISMN